MTGVVLLYHRVADEGSDPHQLCVSPQRFAEHLGVVRRHGSAVSITFDDGYADNAEVAVPLLVETGVRATLFLTAGAIDSGAEFWWDRLERLLWNRTQVAVPALSLTVVGQRLWADVRSVAARRRAHEALYWRLRPQAADIISAVLHEVAAQLGDEVGTRLSRLPMSAAQARRAGAAPGIRIGAHTLSHPWLPTQPASERRREIMGSREAVAALTGTHVESFAYPFGGHDDATVTDVRAAGFRTAYTTRAGRVRRLSDRLRLPRRVAGNWTGAQLEARLQAWLA
jgi:peptidoglycan/xylan/chitin deacetylase (PgdA/CDA1 family)